MSRNKIKELSPMIIKENNTEITNKLEIWNIFNIYFTSVGWNLAKSIHYSGDKTTEGCTKQNKHFKILRNWWKTIKRTINNLPKKNSCDSDGISSNLFKHIAPSLIKFFTLITNQTIYTEHFPGKK